MSSKYHAVAVEVDGKHFASKKEAARYMVLTMRERVGEISGLQLQARFPLEVNGMKLGVYYADFVYTTKDGQTIVEDVKGFKTPVYRLKKKLMRACWGIEIAEV